MNKKEKRQIRAEISALFDNYCEGCIDVPKAASQDKRIRHCHQHCGVGKKLKSLGESLLEGRTEHMAEQRNWDQLCATANKLREADSVKWTWVKIASYLGVSEKNLYYHISKRREANGTPIKRVGASKNPQNTKPSPQPQNVQKTKSEPPKLNTVVAKYIEKAETLDVSWKERLVGILGEKDAMQKELREVSKLYAELKDIKEKLAQGLIAETKARSEAEDALKLMQDQLQSRDEDYNTLLNEFNAVTEKNHELGHDLRKMHINVRAAEETAAKERAHCLELQGRSQALGIALKAVL